MSLKKIDYSSVIEAIEFHWQCLLISRAVFNYTEFGIDKNGNGSAYSTPPFYKNRSINFQIKWLDKGFFDKQENAMKLNYWHNANFIIRLYGTLDEAGCLRWKKNFTAFMLVHKLRNKLGAHQHGLKRRETKELKDINKLFSKLDIEEMQTLGKAHFSLKIDQVAEPLKKHVLKAVKELEAQRVLIESWFGEQINKI